MPRSYRRRTARKGKKKSRKTTLRRRTARKYLRTKRGAKVGRYANVQLIRPIQLKPRSVVQRYVFYGKSIVENGISIAAGGSLPNTAAGVPGFQQMQYVTFFMNTPFIYNDTSHVAPSGCSWTPEGGVSAPAGRFTPWFNDNSQHAVVPDPTNKPTQLPGFFDQLSRAGYQYHNHICIGGKLTVTATPMPSQETMYQWTVTENGQQVNKQRAAPNQSGVLFIHSHSESGTTNPSHLSNTLSAQDLYKIPNTKVRKFKAGATVRNVSSVITGDDAHGAQGTVVMDSGSHQAASLTFSYSPKKMHNLKDIRDNIQMTTQTSIPSDVDNPQFTTQVLNPSELDSITFGIVPEFQPYSAGNGNLSTDAVVPQACGRVLLSYKWEATYLHCEPTPEGILPVTTLSSST